MMKKDTRSIGLDLETLEWAKHYSPSGVSRLAKFIGAKAEDIETVLEACEEHRRAQELESPIRLVIQRRESESK